MAKSAGNQDPETLVRWHALSVAVVLVQLGTVRAEGLDVTQASQRLQQYGPNRLPEDKRRGPCKRFLSRLNNVLVLTSTATGCLYQAYRAPAP